MITEWVKSVLAADHPRMFYYYAFGFGNTPVEVEADARKTVARELNWDGKLVVSEPFHIFTPSPAKHSDFTLTEDQRFAREHIGDRKFWAVVHFTGWRT